jgi:hypothetical protein
VALDFFIFSAWEANEMRSIEEQTEKKRKKEVEIKKGYWFEGGVSKLTGNIGPKLWPRALQQFKSFEM